MEEEKERRGGEEEEEKKQQKGRNEWVKRIGQFTTEAGGCYSMQ